MQRKGNPCELLLVLNIGTATMKNSMQVVQKIKNRTMMRPSIPTSCYLSEEIQNTNLKKKCIPLFIVALFTMARIWKQPKCDGTYI